MRVRPAVPAARTWASTPQATIRSKPAIPSKEPLIRTVGAVWILSEVNGEAYLGDVSECPNGCSYNKLCGTEEQCKEPMPAFLKLIIGVLCFITFCALCTAASNSINCIRKNNEVYIDPEEEPYKVIRKNSSSSSNSKTNFRDDRFLRVATNLDAITERTETTPANTQQS